jgi:transcriptional regulator NrdR family protein
MAREDRFRNVKQAEYELLKVIGQDERIREVLHARMRRGVVGTGRSRQVTLERANKAMSNLSAIFGNMAQKRIKHLPDYHIDYDSEGESDE